MFVCVGIKKTEEGVVCLGACFTPQEQGKDGKYFCDGVVAWKTGVVMVLVCAVGGDKREERGGVVMIIINGLGLGCGYYTRKLHYGPLGFTFPI